ncbi:MAG: response regulator [Deltaproteobacteria bacterium]|nr:response regulator [Deltaproteobacteria bacterium]
MPTVIFVVDDDHDIRVELRNTLEQAGYHVYSASDGASALNLLAQIPAPALILLDMQMPVMNGAQFIAAVTKLPELRDVPIIQISSSPHAHAATRHHLVKPFDEATLLKTVRGCLAGKP